MPPHKRVGSDDGEELSPVYYPGERHECDSGSIIQCERVRGIYAEHRARNRRY